MFVERHEQWIGYNRVDLSRRFKAVIASRGYTPAAVESIHDEHIDKYMQKVREFDIMLQTYENESR